jgi:hypothetical protein
MVWFLDTPSVMSSGIAFLHPSLWASIPEARDRAMELKKREDLISKYLGEGKKRVECSVISKSCIECVEKGTQTSEVGAGFKSLRLR